MIESRYINHNGNKYYYKSGVTTLMEILQNNLDRVYPEFVYLEDQNKIYKYAEFDFFCPKPVVEKILKNTKIIDSVYKKIWTSKNGSLKYKIVLDSFGV